MLATLTLSVPKANLTKPRKLLNPELSNQRIAFYMTVVKPSSYHNLRAL